MPNFKLKLWDNREDVTLTCQLANPLGVPEFLDNPIMDMPPMPTPPAGADKGRPAMIICPGGAYLGCSSGGGEGDMAAARFFAEGYQTFVLEYTVAVNAGSNPTVYPAAFRDLGKAILTVRENAEQWHVDPDKIAICGFSAGGHLCGMLATRWFDPVLSDYFKADANTFRPNAAILCYPAADLAEQKNSPSPMEIRMMRKMFKTYFGTEDPSDEELAAHSVNKLVSEKTAPIFLVHAFDDPTVSPYSSLRTAEACYKNGVPCELHIYASGGHGFGIGTDMFEPYRADKKKRCSKWTEDCVQWLNGLFYPAD